MARLFTIIFFCFSTCAFCQNITYGTTVITHGFQGSGSAPIGDGDWPFEMAEAILEKIGGKGCIRVYQKESGNFEKIKDNCRTGEVILLYDWAAESNRNTKGYSEAAADALFASLILGKQDGDFDLKQIHFIGHSRGTVVNSLTVERLLVLKQQYPNEYGDITIDQVTNIDPHDWGGGGKIRFASDLNDAHPEIQINTPRPAPNNGTIAWSGVFSDTYWQDNDIENIIVGRSVSVLDGRPVRGTMNFQWDRNDLGETLGHLDIHTDGYIRTIENNITINNGGYHLSRLGGGKSSRPDSISGTVTPTFSFFDKNSNDDVGIINGSFDRGDRTFSSIPGWEYHGGSFQSVSLENGFIQLNKVGKSPAYIQHNRFFIPPNAKTISFKYKVWDSGSGFTSGEFSTLLNNDLTFSKSVDTPSSNWSTEYIDISKYAGSVAVLKFEITKSSIPVKLMIAEVALSKEEKKEESLPSLFLFDLSGSMAQPGASNKAKIEEAKSAALTTIQSMKNNPSSNITQEVGILAFSGGCITDPTTPVTNGFLADLDEVERSINAINFPGGGTPLAEAIQASEQKLQQHINTSGAQQAKLIILSDGQATCNPIRPNDVYAFGQSGQVTRQYGASPQASGVPKIKYYTVGFNIAPGSPAERDLQYLAKISGGKYLNAQNQFELTRAFQKFNRIYVPKPAPALENIPNESLDIFDEGINSIYTEIYPDALEKYKEYIELHQLDCHGIYNLALMYEANEYYKSAIANYEQYLQLCPAANDEAQVRKQIELLKKDYKAYLKFNREVIRSDMDYLELHFQKIKNGESVALAMEFIAFIREKRNYYENLSDILEIEGKIFDVNAKAVFRGLESCAAIIKRNPQTWDRDATPLLSRTFLNMERLLQSF